MCMCGSSSGGSVTRCFLVDAGILVALIIMMMLYYYDHSQTLGRSAITEEQDAMQDSNV